MYFLNKIVGSIVGVISGILTAILQALYVYYLFAQNRRAAGYGWFSTLLTTVSIGSILCLLTSIATVFTSVYSILWGIYTGWTQGVIGSLKLPYTFHTEFQKRIPVYSLGGYNHYAATPKGNLKNLFWHVSSLMLATIDYFHATNNQGTVLLSYQDRERLELLSELHHLTVLNRIRPLLNQAVAQGNTAEVLRYQSQVRDLEASLHLENLEETPSNKKILQRIGDRDTVKITLLRKSEIATFKRANRSLPELEQKRNNEQLLDYQDKITCPISLEASDNPITVVLPGNEGARTYNYNALKTWIETRREDAREVTTNRYLLKDLNVYRGYSPQVIAFIDHVRETNKQWQEHCKTKKQQVIAARLKLWDNSKVKSKTTLPQSQSSIQNEIQSQTPGKKITSFYQG